MYVCQAIDAYHEQLSNVWLNKATPDRFRREQAQWRRAFPDAWIR